MTKSGRRISGKVRMGVVLKDQPDCDLCKHRCHCIVRWQIIKMDKGDGMRNFALFLLLPFIILYTGIPHLLLLLHGHAALPGFLPGSVCGWVCMRYWGSRAEALMLSIVIQASFTEATPAGSPGTSPLKHHPSPFSSLPPPSLSALWSHSAGQTYRAVWEVANERRKKTAGVGPTHI